jgi:hypothetical protein
MKLIDVDEGRRRSVVQLRPAVRRSDVQGGRLPIASGTPSIGSVVEVGEWTRFYLGVRASAVPTSSI